MQRAVSALFLLVFTAFGQSSGRLADYALLLADAPAARSSHSRLALLSPEATARRQSLRNAQSSVLAELSRRKVSVRGSSQILVNAIFVSATRETAAQLARIPGVVHVVRVPRLKRDLNVALGLENVSAAWAAVGGATNAGAGIKIGIIDTGIDQNHPGFIDPTLTPPAGFPAGNLNYTNSKVIVARSYVAMDSDTDPTYSTPDDTSPADHFGHGTAIAMIAAGVQNAGPQATIQGVAPKAFLGNYKVFGSPGVNDYASANAINAALEDALTDGMDVVTLSLSEGDMPDYGPLDVDETNCGGACDIYSQMVDSAVSAGLVVVTSAGNDGNIGVLPHTLSTVHTPGIAPAAITVGASYNAHALYQSVTVAPNPLINVLQSVQALYGDGPQVALPALPVVDVTKLQNDGMACAALPPGSLLYDIALIQRGECDFNQKIVNAQNAGALGVILYMQSGSDPILRPTGTEDTGIPAAMIAYSDGVSLKSTVDANTGATAALNLAFAPATNPSANPSNSIWPSSSRGPSIGAFAYNPTTTQIYQTFVIKPELVAVGAGIYTATQKLDPGGDTYNPTGYAGVTGTSYAVPMVAGAVAMVKQMHPTWTPAQLKSAVVNTATQDVTDTDGTVARVDAVGAGKLNAGNALSVAATLDPATIEFGTVSTAPISTSISISVTNVSSAAATFSFAVQPSTTSSVTSLVGVSVSPGTLALTPGQVGSFAVSLNGNNLPPAGSYEGFILVTGGGGTTLRVPYQYLASTLVVADAFPVADGSFTGAPGDTDWFTQIRAIDKYGVPVITAPVAWTAATGGGSIDSSISDTQTFRYGIASGFVNLGSQPGVQTFNGTVGGLAVEFDGFARTPPAIAAGGVVDGAAFQGNRGLAPGSYITIKGANLADATQIFSTGYLPVSLSGVSVSFDGGGLSLPGHLYFVSPGQINVQIPWEFQGQSSVAMKVNLFSGTQQTSVYTVPLASYCPNFFERSGIVASIDYNLGTIVSQTAPARRGDVVELYVNGMGPVTNQSAVQSGQPSPLSPLAYTTTIPTVTIGGVNAPVSFYGLAPNIVGLYQVNITVPAGVPSGTQPIVLSIGGLSTQTSQLPVQ